MFSNHAPIWNYRRNHALQFRNARFDEPAIPAFNDAYFAGGSTHTLAVTNSSGLSVNSDFTLEAVVIPEAHTNCVIASKSVNADRSWELKIDNLGIVTFAISSNGASDALSLSSGDINYESDPANINILAGERCHIVVSKLTDAGGPGVDRIAIYINGYMKTFVNNVQALTLNDNSENIEIGYNYTDQEMKGTIAQVRWFNKGMYGDEIAILDNHYSSLPDNIKNTCEFAHDYVAEMTGATDLTGNSRDLTGITGTGGTAIANNIYDDSLTTQEFTAKPALFGGTALGFPLDAAITVEAFRTRMDFTFVCMFSSKNVGTNPRLHRASGGASFYQWNDSSGQIATNDVVSTFEPVTDSLHSLVITRNKYYTKIMVDGVVVGEGLEDMTFNGSGIPIIGGYDAGSTFEWNGIMTGYYWADTGCSENAAQDLFEAGKVKTLSSMPKWFRDRCYYGFDFHSLNQGATDVTGNGNNSTHANVSTINYTSSSNLQYIESA